MTIRLEETKDGWWSIGNGGHTFTIVNETATPVAVPTDGVKALHNQLAFLIIPLKEISEDGIGKCGAGRGVNIDDYGDARDKMLNGEVYRCWYAKKFRWHNDHVSGELNEAEREAVLGAAALVYGKYEDSGRRYAIISECIASTQGGEFLSYHTPFLPLEWLDQVSFDLYEGDHADFKLSILRSSALDGC